MALSKGKKLLIMGAVLLVIDQVTKVLVKTNMSIGESFPVIGQWFRIAFIENQGMAFGMSFGGVVGKYILTAFRIILSGILIWWVRDLIKKDNPMGLLIPLALITTGAIYFPLIDTYIGGKHITFFDPVFNIADSCVTVGAFWFVIYSLFHSSVLKEDK